MIGTLDTTILALAKSMSEKSALEIRNREEALRAIIKVTNDDEARKADEAVKEAKSIIKAVKDERMSYTRRLDEAKKRFMRREEEIVKDITEGLERVSKLATEYLTNKQAKLEAARKKAEEAAKAEAAVTGESVAVIAPSSNKTLGVKSREYWGFRIIDPLLVPRAYCKPDEVLIGQYKDNARKNGAKIEDLKLEGVEFYKEIRV